MTTVRTLVSRHRGLALVVLLAALCVKALVPAGYMVTPGATVISMTLCDGEAGHRVSQLVIPLEQGEQPAPPDKGCAWSLLAMASLDAMALPAEIPSVVLAPDILRPSPHQPAPSLARHLRPPLRGPPATV